MADFESIRRMALTFPQAVEADHHGSPSARVAGKIFATYRREPARLMVKLDPEDQHNLCAGHPDVVAPVPGYWGAKGSTLVDYARADEDMLRMLLRLAWINVAPKRLREAI